MNREDHTQRLQEALARVAPAEGMAWLHAARARIRAAADPLGPLESASAAARRRLGSVRLGHAGPRLQTPAGPLECARWDCGDVGRALLVLATLERPGLGPETLIPPLYRAGDEVERAGLLRGLALYSEDRALVGLALEAGRTNSLPLFAALAQHNPYPAARFDTHAFNQLVLKALFMGLGIAAVVGLERRVNPELARMGEDYLEERQAARRAVPADIWLAVAPHAGRRGRRALLAALVDPDPGQRYYAAVAARRWLGGDAEVARVLAARLPLEDDPRVRTALEPDIRRD